MDSKFFENLTLSSQIEEEEEDKYENKIRNLNILKDMVNNVPMSVLIDKYEAGNRARIYNLQRNAASLLKTKYRIDMVPNVKLMRIHKDEWTDRIDALMEDIILTHMV